MNVLEITVDLGPGARPVLVETLVRGVRVVADVGRDATLRRIRRAATEQMKFPTDDELVRAIERLPDGGELSPRYRANNLRNARRTLAENIRELPPDLFFDYWYRRGRRSGSIPSSLLAAGYERALAGSPLPWPAGAAVGLDVVDPDLYQALVADQIAQLAPTEIAVREIRYRNPLAETMTAIGTGTEALTKGAGALETLATLGARRKIKKAEAHVAEATADDRVENSRLDLELKREQLRQAQLASQLAEQELLARRIENEQALRALNGPQKVSALAERLRSVGQLDEADAVAALEPGDGAALLELATRDPEVKQSDEPDADDS
jgi:hypothetical protein